LQEKEEEAQKDVSIHQNQKNGGLLVVVVVVMVSEGGWRREGKRRDCLRLYINLCVQESGRRRKNIFFSFDAIKKLKGLALREKENRDATHQKDFGSRTDT
jgi:hypothetical protein